MCFPLFQALISWLSFFYWLFNSVLSNHIQCGLAFLISFSCVIHFNWQVMLASMLMIVN